MREDNQHCGGNEIGRASESKGRIKGAGNKVILILFRIAREASPGEELPVTCDALHVLNSAREDVQTVAEFFGAHYTNYEYKSLRRGNNRKKTRHQANFHLTRRTYLVTR